MPDEIKDYWERCLPWATLAGKPDADYLQKRQARYKLQDYMHEVFGFDQWQGKKVLDVGCGAGIDSLEFARNGAIVTALDLTHNGTEATLLHAKEAGLNIEVVQDTAYNLPFVSNTFDLVYSFGVLHHIIDIERALSEIRRVLKPDGRVMAMLYHRDSLLFAYSILLRGLDGDKLTARPGELASRFSERNIGCPYTKVYRRDEAKGLFEQFFSDVSVSVHYNVIDTPAQRKVKVGVDDQYELGWHLVVKGVKRC